MHSSLGVAVHTVFIGYAQCPAVLDHLSQASDGSRFTAYFDGRQKTIQVVDREDVEKSGKNIGAASATGYLYRRLKGIKEAKASGGYATGNESTKQGGWHPVNPAPRPPSHSSF